MTEVNETPLPGVGVRHEFATRMKARLGVVTHRDGHREVVIYDHADPDSVREAVLLTPEEAATLADLLGGSTITQRLDDLTHEVEGMAIDWVRVEEGSDLAGQSLGDADLRNRVGASVVAVVREGVAVPAPGADDHLVPGETAVVVGTREAVAAAAALLRART